MNDRTHLLEHRKRLPSPPVQLGGFPAKASRALIANGLLTPFMSLEVIYPAFLYVAVLWVVTFPLLTVLLAVLFNRTSARAAA